MLLPYTPDYRWLLDRDDSPWYPSMRLFRQTETRDCVSVVDRVRSELATLVDAKLLPAARQVGLTSCGAVLHPPSQTRIPTELCR